MTKRAERLTLGEAVVRIEKMYPLILREIELAVAEYGALESANEIVVSELKGVQFPGADTYNVIAQTIAHSLALRLAKLLEVPTIRRGSTVARTSNRSDVASLPLMLRLVKQTRCRKFFEGKARAWTPQLAIMADVNAKTCGDSIDHAVSAYRSYASSRDGQVALKRLRDFRNNMLAHSLLSQDESHLPKYNQLFSAHAMVCELWHHLRLATSGVNWDHKMFVQHRLSESRRFWKPALGGGAKRN